MAGPPMMPAETTIRVEPSILAEEISLAELARRAKVSERSIVQ